MNPEQPAGLGEEKPENPNNQNQNNGVEPIQQEPSVIRPEQPAGETSPVSEAAPEASKDGVSEQPSTQPGNTGAVIVGSSTESDTSEHPVAQQTFGATAAAAASSDAQPKKPNNRKKLLILVAALVVLLGASAAAYFLYYIPNKPENMWKAALVNTGKGYDQLVAYTDEVQNIKSWTQSGNFKVSGGVAADGTFEGTSNGAASSSTTSVSAAGMKIGVDLRTVPTPNSTPDIYFKVSGIQGIGSLFGASDPQLEEALNGINNQWYVVDHSLFDQFKSSANQDFNISSKDVNELLNKVGKTSKEYVFTDDAEKSVVVMKEMIGKEKRDGRSVYHYKVGVNKERLKPYLKALCNDLRASKIGKISEDSYDCKSAGDNVDKIKDNDTADAWVDTKTKLMHSIRFTEKDNKANYVEVVQDYTGGDTLPFKLVLSSDENGSITTATIKVTIHKDTHTTQISGDFSDKPKDEGQTSSGKFSFKLQPSSDEVKVDKPSGAKTIIELANDLGLGDFFNGTQSTASSKLPTAAGSTLDKNQTINTL